MKYLLILLLLIATPVWAGVDFDGTDDLINCGNDASIADISSSFTIALWFNPDITSRGDLATIWRVGTDGSKFNLLYGLTASKPQFYISKNCTSTVNSGVGSNTMSNGTWNHVAGVYDDDGDTVKVYLNGVEEASAGTGAISLCSTAQKDFVIGANLETDPAGLNHVNGQISDVAIWDDNLSTAEILLLSSSRVKRLPLQVKPANLKLYIPLDDEPDGTSGDGDTFEDISGNPNDGTGSDGANNTGLTALAEKVLSYP